MKYLTKPSDSSECLSYIMDGRRKLSIKKFYTKSEIQLWSHRAEEAKWKLQIFSYVFFPRLQQLLVNANEELRKVGIIEDPLPPKKKRPRDMKHGKNYNKEITHDMKVCLDSIGNLVKNIRTDERVRLLKNGCHIMPTYINEFDNEGGYFSLLMNDIVQKQTKVQQDKLNANIVNEIDNFKHVDPVKKEAIKATWICTVWDYIYRQMRDCTLNDLKTIPIVHRYRPVPIQSYVDFSNNIRNIMMTLMNGFKDEEYTVDVSVLSIEFVEAFICPETFQKLNDAFRQTFNTYAKFCVVRWWQKVRDGKHLRDEDDATYLRKWFDFDDDRLQALEDELSKVKIYEESDDIFDVMDMVDGWITCKISHQFISDFTDYDKILIEKLYEQEKAKEKPWLFHKKFD